MGSPLYSSRVTRAQVWRASGGDPQERSVPVSWRNTISLVTPLFGKGTRPLYGHGHMLDQSKRGTYLKQRWGGMKSAMAVG